MTNGLFNNSTAIKKSPVVIVKNFIVLQLIAVAVFFLSGVLLDYGEIYEHLPLITSFSFHIVEAIAIFFLETALVFYIFFRWYKDFYNVEGDKIVYGRGIIFRRRTVIPLAGIHSISYRQGPLGKLTKYGDIELKERNSGDVFVMDHVPDPRSYVDFLVRLRDLGLSKNFRRGEWSIENILAEGEHEGLEFKTSFRWDIHQDKINKNLERSVMKTIVAFLNSGGGQLLLGIDDVGKIIGLENDYRSLPKANSDGFQNHFSNVFHTMIGPEYRQFIDLNFVKAGDKECCVISVMPAKKPVYLKNDSGEEFFIRTGNGTTALKLSEAAAYIDSHWRGRLL